MSDNKIYKVIWQDASYSYDKKIESLPRQEITVGFIVKENEDYINIATNIDYDQTKNTYEPDNGFLIPKKVIIKLEEISNG